MLVIFDLLYREYCRARLAEMQKPLLLAGESAKPSKEGHGAADRTHDEKGSLQQCGWHAADRGG
ncbi:hypothetical protein [Bradyrhizobium sp. BR 10261]|uniref:hypothetical protein n=1 Tax=Bradyrhizobium sp. BR 10261 TaxID=2749992 RepID=UPI001E3B98A9|nr:hypothetical protein [Bradyrhizobium sp. BR 10261]